ncbi:T9SS type A sorting domain-containing protein [bacterium]|nr:T9SS type A sorting domain-containing protein [bacterium]
MGNGLCGPSHADTIGGLRCFVPAESDTIYFSEYNCGEKTTETRNATKYLDLVSHIKIYAKPSSRTFNVNANFDDASIYNLIGQQLRLDQNNTNFKVLNYTTGTCFLRFRIDNKFFYRKILFNKN